VLSDLFLHGIGGAKYDQVTDQIIQSFFGFTPPEFATVSATLRLPIENKSDQSTQDSHWQQLLRELRFHPERYIEGDGVAPEGTQVRAAEIIASKRRWLQTPKTLQNARERHVGISAANEALQPFVEQKRRKIEFESDESSRRKRAQAIIRSREYSFCLYPQRQFDGLLDNR
jgi:hypothetical protein